MVVIEILFLITLRLVVLLLRKVLSVNSFLQDNPLPVRMKPIITIQKNITTNTENIQIVYICIAVGDPDIKQRGLGSH